MRSVSTLLRAGVVLAAALVVVAVLLTMGVAWRMSQGPVDLGWAITRIEARVNAGNPGLSFRAGRLSASWAGFFGGSERGLRIHVAEARLEGRDGSVPLAVGAADFSLSMSRLLLGHVVPRDVTVSRLRAVLHRRASGAVTLLGAAEPAGGGDEDEFSVSDAVAELTQPARPDRVGGNARLRHIEQLQRISVDDAVVQLQRQGMGGGWSLSIGSLTLERQPAGGVLGQAAATLGFAGAEARLDIRAELAEEGRTALLATLSPVSTAALQQAALPDGVPPMEGPPGSPPGQTAFDATDRIEADVTGEARLVLDRGLRPISGTVRLAMGSGRALVAGTVIGFDGIQAEGAAAWSAPAWSYPSEVRLDRAAVVLQAPHGAWPTRISAKGAVRQAGSGVAGSGEMNIDHLALADLPALWPERLGGHTRPWLVENITGGTVRNAAFRAEFESDAALSHGRLKAVSGGLIGDDVTINWLRPVPPVEHAQAVLTVRDPDTIDIAIASARQGGVALKDGTIRITGMTVKDQFMTVAMDLQGQVAEVIALLKLPRMHLLDRKPIPMTNPGGTVAGHVTVALPLVHHLEFEQVRIQAQARTTDARLGGLVAGRDLEHGNLVLDASSDALKVTGKAVVAGIATDLLVGMNFRPGAPGQVTQSAQATGRATGAQLAAAGVDPSAVMESGSAGLDLRWAQHRDGSAELLVAADLVDAGLAVAGWTKAAGAAAQLSARIPIRGDRMAGIEAIHATGPGLLLDGRAEMVGDRPLLLVLDRLTLGATEGSGQIRFPAGREPIRATLSGKTLDLTAQMAAEERPGAKPGPHWVADVRFDRVLLGADRGVSGVTAHAENDGRRLSVLQAQASGLRVAVAPDGQGRSVRVSAQDAGALLRVMDVTDTVSGGTLELVGRYDDTHDPAPLAATVEMRGFQVKRAAGLGKLLQAATIYGVLDALNGSGLSFSEMTLPFRSVSGVIEILDARAFSSSLGLTAKGTLDQKRQRVAVQGTVVPAYVLNSMLGRIPLLGRLFSNERGGGLVAVDYTVRGPTANPSIAVNPLSALTPGFLRGLFHLLD